MQLNPPHQGLTQAILDYIKKRETEKLEKFDKEAEKQRKSCPADKLAELNAELTEARRNEENRYIPSHWLDDAAERAKQLQFVTHALKFIHSDAKGTSLFARYISTPDTSYISTAALSQPDFDVVGNAAALDVGKLLLLAHDGQRLIDLIEKNDASALEPLAADATQAQRWLTGFSAVFRAGEPSSHKLAKQTYWPLGDDQYHLLLPLYPTALTQSIYQRIQQARFSEESKAAREKRRNSQASATADIRYPQLATQNFGGTKPQNISQLNSQRGGKAYLLSSAPPNWEQRITPPLNISSVFAQRIERRVFRQIKQLQHYLEQVLPRDNNMHIKAASAEGLDEIVTTVLHEAAKIQQLPAGWSAHEDCRLPMAECLWLDPKRAETDQAFFDERDKDDWQRVVAQNFARWLAGKLESKKMALGATEHRAFRGLLEPELHHNLKQLEGVIL
ncbi:MAG: type I-F CRISPR-associated protein Csy1 [Porticoccaceae bacterium]|nr:type I-F CRISPR-associated protein Csy1 [Porticoccaceae bacterium]